MSYINNNVSTNNINNYVMNFILSFKIQMIKLRNSSISSFYQKKLLQKMKRILIHTNSKQKATNVTSTIMGRYGHTRTDISGLEPMWCCVYNILVCKKGAQNSWFKKKLKKGKASLLFYFSIRPLLATILQSNHS